MLAGGPGRSNGRALLDAAWTGGATACDVAAGQIELGMRADIIVLEAGAVGGDRALDVAVFAPRRNPVRHVVVGGECVVRDGAHRLGAIASAGFRAAMGRLAGVV